ncbi:NAD(P)/FAD-dependent oxidoreductase [Cohnella zeiphila]|uniref:Ferredoxin--NADP reductase n=1 Tax=Cohnella zeiphila TaxID=2761120 RepID=A0A7X0SV49_9BACL|nr:NAD(P)/FAD-dependent oxidoreductase [Cohnella zeiphila]MBB6734433.1 NAD(P)/FAD-dependent oxidoreductase [Cohnella zeiphila]
MNDSDLIIIGGGPAGLFAAFYGGMRNASVTLIESLPQLGGQLSALYPEKYIYDVAGFPKVTAQELVDRLVEQMRHFPVDICLNEQVLQVNKLEERSFEVVTDRCVRRARAVIITGGIGVFEPRRLELEGTSGYERANLHYAISDLSRFAGQKVLITGGGDSAVDWALMLEPIAEKVTLVHRRDKFRAHEHSVRNLLASSVEVKAPWEIAGLAGAERIERATLRDLASGAEREEEVDDVIVSHGFVSAPGPIAQWGIEMEGGSIRVDSRMETNVSGIFAAGDITAYPGKLKLIAVGFGEAPTAVNNAKVYIDPSARLSPGHSSNRSGNRGGVGLSK